MDGNEYVINGQKTWISNGGIADQYVLFARTGGPRSQGALCICGRGGYAGFLISERINVIAPPSCHDHIRQLPYSDDGDARQFAMGLKRQWQR